MKSLAKHAIKTKTARTCEICVKKRAHWYCSADDAFLCQSCDTSVHSANALARRHERVRLKSTSPAASKDSNQHHSASSPPLQEAATWHQWFTRKPRTPRGSGRKNNSSTFHYLVPEIEISADDQTDSSEVEEQLICQVPVVDPMVVEPKMRSVVVMMDDQEDKDSAESCLNGFLPTDMELEQYTADVEALLGHGLDTESYTMEELGLSNTEMFKVKNDEIEEEVEEETKAMSMDIGICDDDHQDDRDGTMPFDLTFGFDSQNTCEEDAIKNAESSGECVKVKEEEEPKNVLMLSLDYDLVISTWGGQGLPWTSGEPPELDMMSSSVKGKNGGKSLEKTTNVGGCVPSSGLGDGGREARVSRYREKRRKRLFTKKIRYEVRKLNAENRPRMKGRFVRSSLAASAGNSPLGVNN